MVPKVFEPMKLYCIIMNNHSLAHWTDSMTEGVTMDTYHRASLQELEQQLLHVHL